MNKQQLMQNAKLLQSLLLSFTIGSMSDEDFKGNLKTITNAINPNIMDMQIKFYSKAEGCSFANRFHGYMTLADLIKGINENSFKIVTQTDYSEAFDQEMEAKVLDLNGNKCYSLVLENGSKIRLYILAEGFLISYTIGDPDSDWLEVLNKECIKKEDADPNFIHLP